MTEQPIEEEEIEYQENTCKSHKYKLGKMIADRLYEKTGARMNFREKKAIVDCFTEVIQDILLSGEKLTINGFGTLIVKQFKATVGMNPKKGVQVKIPKRYVPFFKFPKQFMKEVQQKFTEENKSNI